MTTKDDEIAKLRDLVLRLALMHECALRLPTPWGRRPYCDLCPVGNADDCPWVEAHQLLGDDGAE